MPFEVVPGIPAAIGGLAYAGVPITYPDAGDVVVFMRGHEGGDGHGRPTWTGRRWHGSTARWSATPGRSRSRRWRARSSRTAANADESAALIYDGTLPSQRTVHGTLGGHRRGRRSTGRRGAARVGSVVGLREHLRWFDDRPLFGKRIVVTRSREQAGELVEMLEDRGAEAILAPTIRIAAARRSGRARSRVRRGRHVRLDRLHQQPTAWTLHGAAAGNRRHPRPQGRAALHRRAVDRCAAGAVRPEGRPDAGRVPRRGARRGVPGGRPARRRPVPAAARRHRARAAGRRAARGGRAT